MTIQPLSPRFTRRAGLAVLLALAIALSMGVLTAQAQDRCPENNTAWDPYLQRCVTVVRIDCGPNPYVFNTIGGHWERPFDETCFPETRDPFEGIFDRKTFDQAQDELAQLGLAGLTHDQQVQAFIDRGVWNVEGERVTSKLPPKDYTVKAQRVVDCGPNPYRYNAIGGHYERQFAAFCYPFTEDPNEVEYDGLFFNQTPLAS